MTPALVEALRDLERWGDRRGWLGPDPYEGLNAKRPALAHRTRLGRRLLVQAVKRSPLDLRPLLGIPHRHNTVGVANVLSAYLRSRFLPEGERARKAEHALALLEGLRLDGFDRPCWSYHFDLETRVFFYPKTMPNTIATSFAGMALLDAYEETGAERLLELATGAGEFFLRHVPQTEAGDGAYFGYFIGDASPIHNANVLACGLLARLVRLTSRDDFRSAAERGVAYCLSHQRPDGSWPYGELPNLRWVDGFHTGYVLDALLECERAGVGDVAGALDRGLAFYRDELFLPDGTAKYYATSTYPVDAQCVAQGIQTFVLATRSGRDFAEPARRVAGYALRRMRRGDGAFVFQRRRLWRNATPHIRWVQAPMFLALAHLLELEEGLLASALDRTPG